MSDRRPNVLWITTDQQRWDTLGCYGNAHVETPTLDRLAADGVRFDRAFCQSPACCPSRASFLTGRYPETCGVAQGGQPIPEDERLVTQELAEADYHCGLAGKLHISPVSLFDGVPRSEAEPLRRVDDGYAEFHHSMRPDSPYPGDQYGRWLHENGETYRTEPIEDTDVASVGMPFEWHQTTWCARRAVGFVEDAVDHDQPWLFSLNPFDPHYPFDPPRAYLERYLDDLDSVPLPDYQPGELDDKPAYQRWHHESFTPAYPDLDARDHRIARAAYWAMVDVIDDAVAEVLDALERTGQRENTIVVFTSDHGELLGDHGQYRKGAQMYDTQVRVPLIVSGPGVETGIESDALVELVDLAPTLCDATGIDEHPGMQGRSLWPLLTGGTDPDDHREDVYATRHRRFAPEERDRFDRELLDATTERSRAHVDAHEQALMLRTDRYKVVRWPNLGTGELYDLEADPTETVNRWADPDYAEIKADLLARLADRAAWAVDPLPELVGLH